MTDEVPSPHTCRGRPVGDEEIQRLADEAEAGYDPARLRRVPRKPVPIRIDPTAEHRAPTTDQAGAAAS